MFYFSLASSYLQHQKSQQKWSEKIVFEHYVALPVVSFFFRFRDAINYFAAKLRKGLERSSPECKMISATKTELI